MAIRATFSVQKLLEWTIGSRERRRKMVWEDSGLVASLCGLFIVFVFFCLFIHTRMRPI